MWFRFRWFGIEIKIEIHIGLERCIGIMIGIRISICIFQYFTCYTISIRLKLMFCNVGFQKVDTFFLFYVYTFI